MERARRIEGLDSWRVVLMLGGALVHAAFLQQQRPLFDAIGLISGAFRMGAFFALSGMLAGFSLSRMSPGEWRDRRDVRIGVPALFGILLICPLIQLLASYQRYGTIEAYPLSFEMHHLWFLVALMLYTRLGLLLVAADRRHGLIAGMEGWVCATRGAPAALLVTLGVAIFALMMLTYALLAAIPAAGYALNIWHWQQILGYGPMFLFGMILARAERLRAMLLARRVWPVVILLVAGGVSACWWIAFSPAPLDHVVQAAAAAFCPPAATILILRSAFAIRQVGRLMRSICAASFSIYMLHFPIAVLLNVAAARIDANVYLEYGAVVVLSIVLAYALHMQVIARSPLLSLLLNGDPGRRPTTA